MSGFSVPQLAQVRGKRCKTRCEGVRRVCAIRSRVRTISSLRECKFEEAVSALTALSNSHTPHPIVSRIQILLASLAQDIIFIWIPRHMGIQGNETVDSLAKNGHESPPH